MTRRESAQAPHSFAKRCFKVWIRDGDRVLTITRGHCKTPEEVDTFAVLKAAMRDAFEVSRDTELVLDNCVSGLPNELVEGWMQKRLADADTMVRSPSQPE